MAKERFKRRIRFWFYEKLYAKKPNLLVSKEKHKYMVFNLNFLEKYFLLLVNKLTK